MATTHLRLKLQDVPPSLRNLPNKNLSSLTGVHYRPGGAMSGSDGSGRAEVLPEPAEPPRSPLPVRKTTTFGS